MFNEEQLKVIRYCGDECKRQRSGEESVYDMINAWDYASTPQYGKGSDAGKLTLEFIEHIGVLVEPQDNANGFRQIPIFVGNSYQMIEKAEWREVPRLLTLLLESYYDGDLTADNPMSDNAIDQFYYEYEGIHPFKDGNGRSGKILYNYLKGTLNNPKMPPNFWNISNP